MTPERSARAGTVRSVTGFVWAPATALLLGACSGAPDRADSGFLASYDDVEPARGDKGAVLYTNPEADLDSYRVVVLEPVVVYDGTGAALDLEPAQVDELTTHFHDELVRALTSDGRYTLSTEAAPGAARVRTAITAVKRATPLLNIHPGTTLMGLGLGGAAFEAEAVDAVTGERLFAYAATKEGNRLAPGRGWSGLGHAKSVLSRCAERVRELLEGGAGEPVPTRQEPMSD